MAKLFKTGPSIGSVKHKFYPWLAMLAAFCLLMWTLLKVALPAYAEVRGLWQQRDEAQMQLQRLQEFAVRHANYSAYEEGRYKELVRLKQSLQQLEDSNLLQRQLQLGAVKQGLVLKSMQFVASDNAAKSSRQQLQLELAGEYFALLRWLRQVEKQRLTIDDIEIKGAGSGLVQAKLSLSYPRLELAKHVQDK